MLAALSASRDRQRQLVADAGHELRTPLTSLRTNLDLLTQADRQGGLSEASRAELLDDVRFQIEELTTLIGDLTELARDEPALVRARGDRPRRDHRARRAAGAPPGQQPPVRPARGAVVGDRRLRGPGARGHQPARQRREVEPAARHGHGPPGRTASLLVADQGHGIPESDLPHVFDRFYRSPESRTMPGSGLGLSIVRQVAERHGGTVRGRHAASRAAPAFWLEHPRHSHGRVPGLSQRRLSLRRHARGHDGAEPERRQQEARRQRQ